MSPRSPSQRGGAPSGRVAALGVAVRSWLARAAAQGGGSRSFVKRAATPGDGSRSGFARDAALGVMLALIAFVPPLATHGTRLGDLPYRQVDALAVVVALAQSLPLAFRRRRPAATLAVVSVGFAVQELRGYATFASLGLVIAIYSAAAYGKSLRRTTAAVATAGYVALAFGLHHAGSVNRVIDYAAFYLGLAAGWLLGAYVRMTRSTASLRRRVAEEAARSDERARIARELHDVVTHHVTAMVVQANAAQYLPLEPSRESLTAIKETGKKALGDLRDLLGVLDPAREAPRDRLPGLSALPALIEQTRATGQPVSLIEDGEPPASLGGGRELAAYRVVQESLTNALKYAPAHPTVVRLAYRPAGLDVTVTTAPPGAASVRGSGDSGRRPARAGHSGRGSGDSGRRPARAGHSGRGDESDERATRGGSVGGSGRGLAGLRERVELFGGTLSAGPVDGGGFLVAAHLPAGEAS